MSHRTRTPEWITALALTIGLIPALAASGARADVRIAGTVMDVTGPLVVVRETSANDTMIDTVSVSTPLPADLAPGKTVAVQGQVQQGLLVASSLSVTGRTAWPAPTTPAQTPGRIDHVLFLIQENHSFDNYFGTYPGAEGFPRGLKVPKTRGGPPTVAPFHRTTSLTYDLDHTYEVCRDAMNGGK